MELLWNCPRKGWILTNGIPLNLTTNEDIKYNYCAITDYCNSTTGNFPRVQRIILNVAVTVIFAERFISISLQGRRNDHLPFWEKIKSNFPQLRTNKSKINYRKIHLQHVAGWNDLSTSDLLWGDISHVFCPLPDVCTFHTRFYYTTSGQYGKHKMTTNHTHTHHMRTSQQRGHLQGFM